MGVMVDFDNNITEINNIYNFSYIVYDYKLKLYITGKYEILINQTITINWGDGEISELEINEININLPTIEHEYNAGKYMVKISFITPWDNDEISKLINIPHINFEDKNKDDSITRLKTYENLHNVDIKVSELFDKFKDSNLKLMLTDNHPTTFLFMEKVKILCNLLNLDFFTEEQYNNFLQNENYMELP